MTTQANWSTVTLADDAGRSPSTAMFFDEHQWAVVEAATARIIPTDHDPGAREAGSVAFIDRYLSGYVYASADGEGFLKIEGKEAGAWEQRIAVLQRTYADGISRIDEVARSMFGCGFVELGEQDQDDALAVVSGRPKPKPVRLRRKAPAGDAAAAVDRPQEEAVAGEGGAPPSNQPVPDDALDFFAMLVLHTRQGFYADPAYGGNRNRVGWDVIGFPGPTSLRQTQQGQYTTIDYLLPDEPWPGQ